MAVGDKSPQGTYYISCSDCRRRKAPCIKHGGVSDEDLAAAITEDKKPEYHEDCWLCKKRGAPCKIHGGVDSQNWEYKSAQARAREEKKRLEKEEYKIENIPNRKIKASVPSEAAHQPTKQEPFPSNFSNPYNCSMCARKGSLCEIHTQLFNDSPKTPKIKVQPQPNLHPGDSPKSVIKTTEQSDGKFRIVQIKVSEVTITIKEPI